MTEYELADLLLHRMEISSDFAGLYFSLVSAYLLVGYLAGQKLTTSQVGIITTLYVIWVAGLINGHYNNMVNANELAIELGQLQSHVENRSIGSVKVAAFAYLFVQIAGLFASLYLMWTVRRNKG